MGRAKAAWEEAQERGWTTCDNFVCADCVEDEYLRETISANVTVCTCDYCNETAEEPIAAPVSCIQEEIARTVGYFYCEPTAAGVPYESAEGGWQTGLSHTSDVLFSLGLSCNDALFSDIQTSFTTDFWAPSAQGHWASSHPHEMLSGSWDSFVELVKHRTRYFFSQPGHAQDAWNRELGPAELLAQIGNFALELDLCKQIDADSLLYRARIWTDQDLTPEAETMGAPPPDKAAAGRMNPAGISYLYLAREQQTALAETLSRPPCVGALAQFRVSRPLRVLDLAVLPSMPSLFDNERRGEWTALTFLEGFVEAITTPVAKDGREHINYVPSQVVSEYFAKMFQDERGEQLDGIVYQSTVRPSGQNVVLFPNDSGTFEDKVVFESGCTASIADWPTLLAELK
ncbi:HEPN-associated N-terminal domain-containing protein [Cupriavidus pauculus]|uniref:RES domain-containing protein n=1 Tax=Cupriavidus pauculus TaxID=82633 RepID=A0A3G8GZW9_9BURK|nr:HEPN-associated N-terminal domain-containing protein [Cupriavidus pauculus]AZG13791.1 RES domain-containing protein [Cupriavidus pauculus]